MPDSNGIELRKRITIKPGKQRPGKCKVCDEGHPILAAIHAYLQGSLHVKLARKFCPTKQCIEYLQTKTFSS